LQKSNKNYLKYKFSPISKPAEKKLSIRDQMKLDKQNKAFMAVPIEIYSKNSHGQVFVREDDYRDPNAFKDDEFNK
jgi:hypothetical protein